jgi:glycosyltransferase involved in cell wall biosynthesis
VKCSPRVAFFPDSYEEINGVARTSRQLVRIAEERRAPFLYVCAGTSRQVVRATRDLTRVELDRSRWSFGLERDLKFDLRLWRHTAFVRSALDAFKPDVIHITGPSDIGQLGAYLAHRLRVPLVASWHTNVHDFSASRLTRLLRRAPARVCGSVAESARRATLRLALDFYKMARVTLAPNQELAALLSEATGRRVFPMPRGVDTALFSPARRTPGERPFRIGYVGRLSPEKDVQMLADLATALRAAGAPPFACTIVGDGSERGRLMKRMPGADFPGMLTGEALAAAYADMDVFVFPSRTDTYGNVVLESFAAGTPVIVSSTGGPKFLVKDGDNGFVASDVEGFRDAVLALMASPERLASMRRAARARAFEASWDHVVDQVYAAYAASQLPPAQARPDRPDADRDLSWLARLVTASLR